MQGLHEMIGFIFPYICIGISIIAVIISSISFVQKKRAIAEIEVIKKEAMQKVTMANIAYEKQIKKVHNEYQSKVDELSKEIEVCRQDFRSSMSFELEESLKNIFEENKDDISNQSAIMLLEKLIEMRHARYEN